eukprot:comp22527_c0_seq1/m.34193 comp22527_c0_seq1/g.34193  ORF comp22527_c0_seq1/g.34193 comp22527_c0_seq1/m.34193 type:complete len:435 (-) comp22527_c0_seq1:521-1825(-)
MATSIPALTRVGPFVASLATKAAAATVCGSLRFFSSTSVRRSTSQNPEVVTHGLPPLHSAAASGDVKGVHKLLLEGYPANQRSARDYLTPLHVAVCALNPEVTLGDVNLPVMASDKEAHHYAEVVRLLLQHEADPLAHRVRHTHRTTLLHDAARVGSPVVIQALLKECAGRIDVNESEFLAGTPLHIASQYGHTQVAKQLLDAGADSNSTAMATESLDAWHVTPLHVAAHRDMVCVLLEHGANVDARQSGNLTPLHYSAMRCDPHRVETLLRANANPMSVGANGQTSLLKAVKAGKGHPDLMHTVQVLLAGGCDVNAPTIYGETPLWYAVINGDAPLVKYLLESGADVEFQAYHTSTNSVAGPDREDMQGHTQKRLCQSPLQVAVAHGQISIAKLLIDHRAAVDQVDGWGRDLTTIAKMCGTFDVVKSLLGERV